MFLLGHNLLISTTIIKLHKLDYHLFHSTLLSVKATMVTVSSQEFIHLLSYMLVIITLIFVPAVTICTHAKIIFLAEEILEYCFSDLNCQRNIVEKLFIM